MVFEKDANGMLHQVPETAKEGRRFHTLDVLRAEVLFTAEEEAARNAEEAQSAG